MKAHFSKKPYCLSCRRQLKDEEVAVHEHQSHRITHDYIFGGYDPVDPIIEVTETEISVKRNEETRRKSDERRKEEIDWTEGYASEE